MDRTTAYPELRRLLAEAVPVLGERWLALGLGCHPCSIKTWLMRQDARLQERTVARMLPRLRTWQMWVPAYQASRAEGRRLVGESAHWENRIDEFRHRLLEALSRHSLPKVAAGCEVREKQLLLWYIGHIAESQRDDLLKALGFMRYLDSWPGAREESEVTVESA